jgi:hypothetical protein
MADAYTQLRQITRTSKRGTINTALTLVTKAVGQERSKLVAVFVAYDVAMTGDITVTLTSGVNSSFDVRLGTISLAAQRFGVYRPDGGPLDLAEGDKITVAAAAGGSTSTASVMVYEDQVPLLQEGPMAG